MTTTVTEKQLSWYRYQGKLVRIVSRIGRRYVIEVSEISL